MKALRRSPEGVIVAMYLMTSPSSNMLGLFCQPVLYMAHETGLGLEGASKGLRHCVEAGFCSFDEESEFVWVHEMARYQIANEIKASDNRCKGIQKDYDALPDNPFLGAFFDRYSQAFHLTNRRGSEAPSKPLRSQEQEQEQEQEKEQEKKKPSASSPAKLTTCPLDQIVAVYHEVLPELPKVRVMDKAREKAIRERWAWVMSSTRPDGTRRAETLEQGLTWFREYFGLTRENDFLMGRTPRSGEHANWRPDIEFLCKSQGLKHVLEKTPETTA